MKHVIINSGTTQKRRQNIALFLGLNEFTIKRKSKYIKIKR